MKKCSICKVEKPLDEFNNNSQRKDGKQNKCKSCSRQVSKKHYNATKDDFQRKVYARRSALLQKVEEYKSDKHCTKCSENDPCCLDFHHIRDKKHEISNMAYEGYSWESILDEIAKCVILCSNCHRKHHAGRLAL